VLVADPGGEEEGGMGPTLATTCAAVWALLGACACDGGGDRLACTTGTWRATLTSPDESVVSCGTNGQLRQDLTLAVVELEAGGYLSSVTHTPADPPPGQACDGFIQRWNGGAFQEAVFAYFVPTEEWVDCNGTKTTVTVTFGIDATVSTDCSQIVGTAWLEPADPCDAASGRWQASITFEEVVE
jgi:hypothetical protein